MSRKCENGVRDCAGQAVVTVQLAHRREHVCTACAGDKFYSRYAQWTVHNG
jgi:hypothetical protein